MKVEFEKMLPHEMEEALRRMPVAFVPWGAMEWHGPHLPLGLDAIKAHEICRRSAELAGGGVVMPPGYISYNTMRFPWTFKFPSDITHRVLWNTLLQLEKMKFKAVIVVTGHYPISQVAAFIAIAELFMAFRGIPVAACPEFFVGAEKGYHGDHAAKWETSIIMELFPGLVDMERLAENRDGCLFELHRQGVMGADPAETASRELGADVVKSMVECFAELAVELSSNHDKKIARDFHRKRILPALIGKSSDLLNPS